MTRLTAMFGNSMTDQQIADAINAYRAERVRSHAVGFALLYRTGIRCQEALDLYSKDIDADVCCVTVLHGKNNRSRTVGIDPKALYYLDLWVRRRAGVGHSESDPLFCTSSGKKISDAPVAGERGGASGSAGLASGYG